MGEQVINEKEFKKLINSLHTFTQRVQKNVVTGAIRAGTAVIRDEMKASVPVDSGQLKKAIVVRKGRTRGTIIRYSAMIRKIELSNGRGAKNTRQYAYYIEYGTRKMPARSFIRTALGKAGGRPLEASRRYFIPRLEKEKKKLGFK